MTTMCVIIAYETISPAVLEMIASPKVPCFISYRDLDEDCFEFTVTARLEDMKCIERILAQYV